MQKPLLLNDLLHLDQADLDRAKVKCNQFNGEIEPMDAYLRNPDEVNNSWLFWRAKRRYFKVGEIAICLLQLSRNTWLLSTIKEVTRELGVKDGLNYEGEELKGFHAYFGRVIGESSAHAIKFNYFSLADKEDVEMKIGFRTPSLKKRISARTSIKRQAVHRAGLKMPRGYGWVRDPKKYAYNKVYQRTSFDIFSTLKKLFKGSK